MRAESDETELTSEQAAAADAGLKAMIPIDRPFLDYTLSALADAGLRRVCLVIGQAHDAIRNYYSKLKPRRLSFDFCIQQQPRGAANAVSAAENFVGDDDFIVVNSDNYYPASVVAALRELPTPGLVAFSRDGLVRDGQIPAERIAAYALLELNPDESLKRIIEKPTPAEAAALGDARVSMNCWSFTPDIFEACRRVPLSARGELELPQAVQFGIDRLGMKFHTMKVDAPVLDLSYRADIPSVTARLAGTRVEL
jgi:dTDP-glucose pyrophosphorylase